MINASIGIFNTKYQLSLSMEDTKPKHLCIYEYVLVEIRNGIQEMCRLTLSHWQLSQHQSIPYIGTNYLTKKALWQKLEEFTKLRNLFGKNIEIVMVTTIALCSQS